MRTVINWNENWLFYKGTGDVSVVEGGEGVTLPHTWNATDGQDGGNDYFRGDCLYKKALCKAELPEGMECYLEICGANSSADVYVNRRAVAHHDGGYSTWRVALSEHLLEDNEIAILVNNAPNDSVYPQTADFTFYGGLYRDVKLICVPHTHFDLEYYGTPGVAITPVVQGANALVRVKAYVSNLQDGDELVYTIYDEEENAIAQVTSTEKKAKLTIENARLWKGRKDPYLYRLRVELIRGGVVLDSVCAKFGCRTFEIHPQKGFLLNGEEYPLRGVSRHQDRWGIGNALLPEHHHEDIDFIMELGATTVRLAHYQHDQYFYDLCDEKGLVVWAEIPYISRHLPNGVENTISQMKELIIQNYNHPSIVVWGLSNEITMGGTKDPDLLKNHLKLNDLVHGMDKTRYTTMACFSSCGIDEPYVQIPDTLAYNHYFGWYGGDTSMNGPWFDHFHERYPDKPIGVSEYGCEGLNWHTSTPTQGDYTEEYQARYHEELIKQLFTRKYLWATYVWNMFDFGADARSEGGESGQNHKGLVTFDRKYKKDAFYAYKAWLSDEPFVHLCGKRYVDRVEEVTKITLYSNQPEVELFVNGKSLGRKQSHTRFFTFDVPNVGESELLAVAGECRDESRIRKVETPNQAYILKEKNAVLNWFEVESPEDRYSLNDRISDITASFRGRLWSLKTLLKIKKKVGKKGNKGMGFDFNEEMKQMVGGFTVLRLSGMMGMFNLSFTKEELLHLNKELNQIKKPKKLLEKE